MAAPEIYLLQFYRVEPGDLGMTDLPVPSTQDIEKTATQALLGYFNNPNIAPQQRPHHARVVSHDEFTVILTLMATGPTTVEKV